MSGGPGGRRGEALTAVWSEAYEADIGRHVFPTSKYRLVVERLLEEGTLREEDLARPEPAGWDRLALVHTEDYLRKIREDGFTLQEEWRLEVPLNDEFRRASRVCAGGSILAGRAALEEDVAAHVGGGFHHAFADHGEGFCLLNDVAVALAVLLEDGSVERAAVVDLDVHQGNGTAAIFAEDDRVFTASMHQEHNYPAHKPPSDLDVGLPDGTDDARYLELLRERVLPALEAHDPDLVFYLAGADPYRDDQLGGLALTLEGLRERDGTVLRRAREEGFPVAVALAGGYAFRLEDTVEIHCNTVREAVAARTD